MHRIIACQPSPFFNVSPCQKESTDACWTFNQKDKIDIIQNRCPIKMVFNTVLTSCLASNKVWLEIPDVALLWQGISGQQRQVTVRIAGLGQSRAQPGVQT